MALNLRRMGLCRSVEGNVPAQPRPQDARTGLNNILRAHRSGLAESKIASAEPIRASCAYLITEKFCCLLPAVPGICNTMPGRRSASEDQGIGLGNAVPQAFVTQRGAGNAGEGLAPSR